MEKLNFLASVIIIVSVLAGIITIILPDKKLDKTAQTLIIAVVLMTVITTVRNVDISNFEDFDITEEMNISNDIYRKADSYAIEAVQCKAEQLISDKLGESNILYTKINVIADRNENGSISIKEVAVELKDTDKYQRPNAEKLLSEYLGSEISLNVE